MSKKVDIFNLIIQEYDKRNSLMKAGAGEKDLDENEKNIDVLIDRYIDECAGKVRERKRW